MARETPRKQSVRMDDYLASIAMLAQQNKVVRVTQISKTLEVKNPSVTSALKKLSEKGLVEHEKYGQVELTDRGEEIARKSIRQRKAISRFFIQVLGVDRGTAEEDARKIRYFISPLSMELLTKFEEVVLTAHKEKLID